MERNPELFDPSNSILEVGSGDNGIALYLKRPVTGLEPRFGKQLAPLLTPVVGTILEIPFPDEYFDSVLCVDVLEHLEAAKRPKALRELLRVARCKAIISCPCDVFAAAGDHNLAELFKRTPIGVPDWLQQHLQHGIPTMGELFDAMAGLDVSFDIRGNEGIQQHFGGILLDHFFPFSGRMFGLQESKSQTGVPIRAGEADCFYSYVFTLFKKRPVSPARVDEAGKGNAGMASCTTTDRAAPTVKGPAIDRTVGGEPPVNPESVALGKEDIGLYSVFHRPADVSHLGNVIPIFSGSAAEAAPLGALTDIPSHVPRLPNHRWSELSAIYKIWQDGQRSRVVGFCHYRRLFNFSGKAADARETRVAINQLGDLTNSFIDPVMISRVESDAIIVPPPIDVRDPVWINYCMSHYPEDYCRVLGILSERHPHLLVPARTHFHSSLLFANNMFVMAWNRFDELCRLWFDVLCQFEQQVPYRTGNPYQGRDVAFLAERIFDIWLKYRASQGTQLLEVPIYFVEDALPANAVESARMPPTASRPTTTPANVVSSERPDRKLWKSV